MGRIKRVLALGALILGIVGSVVCLVLAVGSMVVDSRLRSATRSAYSDVDKLFNQAKSRVDQFGEVVDDAKLSTNDVKESLAEWTSRAAEDRLTQELSGRLELDTKADNLAVTLAKADSVAEMSADSVSLVMNVAEMANQAGAQIQTEGLQSLQQEIEQLQGKLGEAVDDVANLSSRLRDEGDTVSLRERLAAATELALRILSSLDVIQSGLDRLDAKLEQAQQNVADTEPKFIGWIRLATIAVILLLVWNLAGQLALGRSGWRTLRMGRRSG